MSNPYIYTVFKMSEASEIASEGFDIKNVSTDGLLVVVDKKSPNEPTVSSAPSLPSYLDSEDYPDWPNMTCQKAHDMITIEATGDGLSDGWYFNG